MGVHWRGRSPSESPVLYVHATFRLLTVSRLISSIGENRCAPESLPKKGQSRSSDGLSPDASEAADAANRQAIPAVKTLRIVTPLPVPCVAIPPVLRNPSLHARCHRR